MLTNPEAASVGIADYRAQIAQALAADADLRAALGRTQHPDPAQIIALLRPCMLSLALPDPDKQ